MITVSNDDKERWISLVRPMKLPQDRQELTEANMRWFLRQGAIQNMSHPNCQDVIGMIRELLRD
jgi:hypothetical protein